MISTKLNVTNVGEMVYKLEKNEFFDNTSNHDILRFLTGIYRSNKQRFRENFLNQFDEPNNFFSEISKWMDENFEDAEPFTYKEAFQIKNNEFQSLVFGSIDISEMISNLGSKRLKVEGIPVIRKIYSNSGELIGNKEYDNIYETYEVSGKKLGLEECIYALKCWCTSTNKEHWLWIESEYKDSPLDAVASTFRIHENIIPHIKELKRQGDIMICEMEKNVEPQGKIVPLTKEQYFSLLTSET